MGVIATTMNFKVIIKFQHSLRSTHGDNLCNKIIHYRELSYKRGDAFSRMIKKHALGKCNCKKTRKTCDYHSAPILVQCQAAFNQSDDKGNHFVRVHFSFFDTMYHTGMSVTQSLRSCAGRDFEYSIETVLKEHGFIEDVHYSTQVSHDHKKNKLLKTRKHTGHTLDFVFPAVNEDVPSDKFKDYKLVSVKTTTRERFRQDNHLRPITLLTIDETYKDSDTDIKLVLIKKDSPSFNEWVAELKKFCKF